MTGNTAMTQQPLAQHREPGQPARKRHRGIRRAPMGSAEVGARGPPPTRYTCSSSNRAVWLAGLSSCREEGGQKVGNAALKSCMSVHTLLASQRPLPSGLGPVRCGVPTSRTSAACAPQTHDAPPVACLVEAVKVFLDPHFPRLRSQLARPHHHAARPRQLENLLRQAVKC